MSFLPVIYISNVLGVVIVYDITDENSFENIANYLRELKFFIPPDAEILLMGNKCDLAKEGERRIEFKTADAYCEKMGLSVFEVSAKTGKNITEAFTELALRIREKLEVGKYEKPQLNGAEIFGEPLDEPPIDLDHKQKAGGSWMFWCCA